MCIGLKKSNCILDLVVWSLSASMTIKHPWSNICSKISPGNRKSVSRFHFQKAPKSVLESSSRWQLVFILGWMNKIMSFLTSVRDMRLSESLSTIWYTIKLWTYNFVLICIEPAQRDYPLALQVTKIIEIPIMANVPMPYQQHTLAKDDPVKEYKLDINIRFGNINNLYQSLHMLYSAFISKN